MREKTRNFVLCRFRRSLLHELLQNDIGRFPSNILCASGNNLLYFIARGNFTRPLVFHDGAFRRCLSSRSNEAVVP